jgi:hypothetical protein
VTAVTGAKRGYRHIYSGRPTRFGPVSGARAVSGQIGEKAKIRSMVDKAATDAPRGVWINRV